LRDRDRELGCSKPLPVILKPVPDEQLSSWLSRHATFYGMPPIEFFRRLTENSAIPNIRAVDKGLTDADATKLGSFLHCDQSQIQRMTHSDLANGARWFLSQKPIQTCNPCRLRPLDLNAREASPRYSYRGWRITCPLCSSKLSALPVGDDAQQDGADPHPPAAAWDEAHEGERRLDQFLTADETAASAVAAFRMLLVPRASPLVEIDRARFMPRAIGAIVPWFDECAKQPKMSDGWKNHLIVPLPLRVGMLVGFRWLLEKPRPRFHILRSITLGNYRLQLETLGAKATPILGPLWFS